MPFWIKNKNLSFIFISGQECDHPRCSEKAILNIGEKYYCSDWCHKNAQIWQRYKDLTKNGKCAINKNCILS